MLAAVFAVRLRRAFVRFEIYLDNMDNYYRWRLLASDGQVTATARDRYASREEARRAVVALQASIPVARIVDPPAPAVGAIRE
ncbi:MAG TPA: DUF1508 domain-containing protein [Gaiellaceae bacterium]|nr:DUF1508 domain-containing protein [Gaiellaceae bacterium]